MEIIDDVTVCPWPGERAAITIGAYDGVHLGHREIIAQVRRRADALGARSVVVTFDRHPASVVRPESAPRLLTSFDQKLELLAATGVDAVAVVRFDERRAAESATEFAMGVLIECLRTEAVVVGEDFHFGARRAGNVALLRELGRDHGFAVEPVELISVDHGDAPVSSTRIRAALVEGHVDDAARWLGRPFELRGRVDTGDQRGRTLGFPTANVAVASAMAVPADGVYAAWYRREDGSVYRCAVNIGRRPTFYAEAEQSLVEAHILDFDGELYGEPARVSFVARLRGERRFDGIDALVAQLALDVDQVDRLLQRGAGAAPPS